MARGSRSALLLDGTAAETSSAGALVKIQKCHILLSKMPFYFDSHNGCFVSCPRFIFYFYIFYIFILTLHFFLWCILTHAHGLFVQFQIFKESRAFLQRVPTALVAVSAAHAVVQGPHLLGLYPCRPRLLPAGHRPGPQLRDSRAASPSVFAAHRTCATRPAPSLPGKRWDRTCKVLWPQTGQKSTSFQGEIRDGSLPMSEAEPKGPAPK